MFVLYMMILKKSREDSEKFTVCFEIGMLKWRTILGNRDEAVWPKSETMVKRFWRNVRESKKIAEIAKKVEKSC